MIPILIITTIDNEEKADELILTILHKKLAVCCQKFKIQSSYIWEGEIINGNEISIHIKTFDTYNDKIYKNIKELHTYDTFEFYCIKMENVDEKYLKWMRIETNQGD
ncbi:hypothetical protein GVAV_000466 [Gurleya vavrai]